MMNNTLKNLSNLKAGTLVDGKWHKKRYVLVKKLGSGANGVVYLAQDGVQQVALKLSPESLSITSEVNVLKSFAKVQGSTLGPSLIDVDDWLGPFGKICFYVMEYIKGPTLLDFTSHKGETWVEVLILQLLKDLDILHENGWVFGDLKPENLIVTGPPATIRCIDVGGTTLQGRAIKEFTEFYDRGYWALGSRKAERTYDLFAVAMIFINTAYPKRFPKQAGGIVQLQEVIRKSPQLIKYENVLASALLGKYQTAREMRQALLNREATTQRSPMNVRPQKPIKPVTGRVQKAQATRKQPTQQTTNNRQMYVKQRKKKGWAETFVIFMTVTFFYVLYIFVQL